MSFFRKIVYADGDEVRVEDVEGIFGVQRRRTMLAEKSEDFAAGEPSVARLSRKRNLLHSSCRRRACVFPLVAAQRQRRR